MKNYMKTILNAIMAYINDKTKVASDEEIIALFVQEDTLVAVADGDGAILTDENGNILLW